MEKNQTVSLGCGTLILIALIVLIFGSGPSKDQLEQIHQQLTNLNAEVSKQAEELRALREMLERMAAAAPAGPSEEGSAAD